MRHATATPWWTHREAKHERREMTGQTHALPGSVKWLTLCGTLAFGCGIAGYGLGGATLPEPWAPIPLLVAGIGLVLLGAAHRRVGPYLSD
jgi:hypothetical protein